MNADEGATSDVEGSAILAALLRSLTMLEFVARHLDPLHLAEVIGAVGAPDDALRLACANANATAAGETAAALLLACNETLGAFDDIRAAFARADDFSAVFRAFRHLPRAQEALYPLAADMPAVNQYFLDASLRDESIAIRFMRAATDGETGVMHVDNEVGSRGGFSLYVPETYTADRTWPLVIALHGGHGNGRAFLWSWLRDARSFGAILAAPTAMGRTWALMGDDADTPNLDRVLDFIGTRWRIDPARVLLTGMSDGGTFCYVSGLAAGSRFTHLAPMSATFHPLMAAMADGERIRGLPIYIVHGARDWMFPVEVARSARQALVAAGADVAYREIDDLSHCYPREMNREVMAWLDGAPAAAERS
jgi:phospholipase/carboxylesterase